MKKHIHLLIIGMIACTGAFAQDSKEQAKEKNKDKFEKYPGREVDALFAVNAMEAGIMEVSLGTLAATNSSSPEIKKLGKMITEDHQKANDELRTIADRKNMTIPEGMGEKNKKRYEEIMKLQGKEFDKAFVDEMIKGHKDAIALFEKAASTVQDPELKAFANSKISTLKYHLAMVEKVAKTQ